MKLAHTISVYLYYIFILSPTLFSKPTFTLFVLHKQCKSMSCGRRKMYIDCSQRYNYLHLYYVVYERVAACGTVVVVRLFIIYVLLDEVINVCAKEA